MTRITPTIAERRRSRCRRCERAGSRSASAVPRSNVGDVETATDAKHRSDHDRGGDGPPPPRCEMAVRHRAASNTLSGRARPGQPPPVVEPGGDEPTRERAGVGDERLDGVRVTEAADHSPERHDRQHPRNRMLGPTCRQQERRSARERGCLRDRRTSCRCRRARRARARRRARLTSERRPPSPASPSPRRSVRDGEPSSLRPPSRRPRRVCAIGRA